MWQLAQFFHKAGCRHLCLGGGQQAASGPATTAVESMPAHRGSTQQRQIGTPGTVLLPALPVSNYLADMSKSCL